MERILKVSDGSLWMLSLILTGKEKEGTFFLSIIFQISFHEGYFYSDFDTLFFPLESKVRKGMKGIWKIHLDLNLLSRVV